jgi:hypothetical protein
LERPRVVPIVFEERLYEELKRVASSRGMSVSALIREIVLKYLGSTSSVQVSDPPATSRADPPPGVDLVAKMDIEELEEELSEVERAVDSVERALLEASKLQGGLGQVWLKRSRDRLLETLVRAESALKKLRQKYHCVKRRARSSGDLEQLAARMYSLRSRIRELKKGLR